MKTAALDQLANLRDLGGLQTGEGRRLRHGILLRSDVPQVGDTEPSSIAWPPSLVVDLRSATDREAVHPLDQAGTQVVWVPMAADADPSTMLSHHGTLDISLLYRRILDALAVSMTTIFDLLLHTHGPTLVHCVAGKDRTGVLIAVLLAAAGVSRRQIVADYQLTGPNIGRVMERMIDRMPPQKRSRFRNRLAGAPAGLFDTPPEGITAVLDELENHPGGPTGWLEAHGVHKQQADDFGIRIRDDQG